jgi:hypothetical protein
MDLPSLTRCIHGAVPKMIVERFNDMLTEFMMNLRDTFVGCELEITAGVNQLQLAIKFGKEDIAVQVLAKLLTPDMYDRCTKRDEQVLKHVFRELKQFISVDMDQLWQQCPAEVRENIWLYVVELATLVKKYQNATSCSQEDVLRKVEQIDGRVHGMMQQGMTPTEVLGSLMSAAFRSGTAQHDKENL